MLPSPADSFRRRLYLAENGAQRFLGSDAVALSSMCPSCVIADPRGMLGVPLAAARDAQSSRVVGAFNHTLVPSDPPSRGKKPAIHTRASGRLNSPVLSRSPTDKKRAFTSVEP